jgi:hypothetical protein
MRLGLRFPLVLALPAALAAAVTVQADGITRLYGGAAELEGAVSYQKGANWTIFNGAGSASWTVSAASGGEYEVAVCYASKSAAKATIAAGQTPLAATLRQTTGVFDDGALNFERVPLDGKIRLKPGTNRIVLRIDDLTGKPLRLRSLELTPVAALADIRSAAAKAHSARADTSWLATAGYGVMFHWTSQSQPRTGPIKPYAAAVKDFDVAAFSRMVEETGAAYVLFTVNHAEPYCPAPIASWERAHPGTTTQRDLIAELAAELGKRRVRLMLYFASHVLGGLGKSTAADYERIHREVLTEIGERYRDRISGYWFDGWYQSLEAYPEIRMERLWPAVKAGNPARLVAYNFWVYPVETDWQEYWAAEVGGIVKTADGRFPSSGPGKGLQYQNLIMADAPWVHTKAESEMEAPRFKDDALIEYVRACMSRQGAVTINLGIYQDGSIGEATLRQMKVLRQAIRGN